MVNFASVLNGALAASAIIGLAAAHPGEKHDHAKIKREIDVRGMRAAAAKRSLGACQNTIESRQLMQRSVQRRAKVVNELRQKRSISGRK
jgi:hypothetical protein